jgi:hypothetical protein
LGARSLVSLVAILLIVGMGTYGLEKRWDDDGSAEVTAAVDDPRQQQQRQQQQSRSRINDDGRGDSYVNIIQITEDGSDKKTTYVDELPQGDITPEQRALYEQLEQHYCNWSPTRSMAMAGWVLLAFSLLLDSHDWIRWATFTVSTAIAMSAIAIIATVQVVILNGVATSRSPFSLFHLHTLAGDDTTGHPYCYYEPGSSEMDRACRR